MVGRGGVVRRSKRAKATPTRSRKGCPECRRRKIKCDERQPRCGPCEKQSRSCHVQDSVFRHSTFSFGQDSPQDDDTSHGLAPSDSPNDNRPPSSPRPSSLHAATAETRLDDSVTHRDTFIRDQTGPSRDHDTPTAAQPPPALGLGGNLLHIAGNDATSQSTTNAHRRWDAAAQTPITNPHELTIESLKDTQEELFLLRHYSQCIAPWMDLLYRYEVFSREVLTLARNHPILRYAACAVAAKQLGQMKDQSQLVPRSATQERITARLVEGKWGLVWYGIKYYEKAIQTLAKSITPKPPSAVHATVSVHEEEAVSPAVSLSRGDLMVRADGEDPIVRLLGTCILIQYEHLSANRGAWSGHLTGFSKLLGLINNGELLHQSPLFEQVYPWTKDIMEVKAGFWNFVVNDMEESYVSHRQTRIDTENLALWRNMGLLIEDDGRLQLADSTHSLSTTAEHARDKVLSYSLIRLTCKIIDYLSPPPHGNPEGDSYSPFTDLEGELDEWYRMVSPSFIPDGVFHEDIPASQDDAEPSLFSRDVWFSNDLCSTTMLYYHMARLLLLIHKPKSLLADLSVTMQGPWFDLLHAFREAERDLRFHASEIISIARGSPCDAVRLRAIQPLYVAGRCCKSTEERKALVNMLVDTQDNLGVATGYRIEALLQEWGMSYRDFGIEVRLTVEEQLG